MTPAVAATTFAERLKAVLAERNLTQIDLARRIGVTQSAVSLWLRGTAPSRRRVEKIAIHFGLDEAWLHTGKGAKDLSPEARQVRESAKAIQRQTAQRLLGVLHGQTRTITVHDSHAGVEEVFSFDGATDEQWALIMRQIQASHHLVSDRVGGSHPAS